MTHSFLSAIVGSFATPAAENPTVAIVEASFRATGTDARYLNCDVPAEKLADAVRGAVAQGWLGFNCSLPHKEAVLALLDELTPAAQIIGAVNCVRIVDGRLIGDNTDGKGFLEALRSQGHADQDSVVILGAGGAARAIAVELALAGTGRITIVNRSVERAEKLAEHVAASTHATTAALPWTRPLALPAGATMLVNATSIGLFPDPATPDIDWASVPASTVVADVVTNPPLTRFLAAAGERGCATVDGQGMLVNQAAVAIEQWTGSTADRDAMHAELRALFPAPA